MSSVTRNSKGKFIKKKELKRRKKVAAACAQIWKKKHNAISGEIEPSNVCIGNRIVDIQVLAKNLKCKECKLHLSLQRIKKEIKRGLLSTFMIRCDQCQTLTQVDTGEFHLVAEDAQVYIKDKVHNNVTTNAVLGSLNAGVGCTELNKILACLDIPTISTKIFRKYEQEIGPAIEAAARSSCKKAALTERKLVLRNVEELRKEM